MRHPILTKEEQVSSLEEHLRWLRSMETGYRLRVENTEKELRFLKDHE